MFFFGRKSEKDLTPKVALDLSASFEGGTRWTSHFHMPTLLAVDIICVQPGVRGLGHLLLAHIGCLTSSFTADRTHWLFDISGRESNTRMIRFTQGIGASHMQTFADEARSEGYVGVEGDDPSIYWTYKTARGFGENDGRTAGVYAVDVELSESISTEHQAVLFNDRVTQSDFLRGGKNCSYFAVAPLDASQAKLTQHLSDLRLKLLDESKGAEFQALGVGRPPLPWQRACMLTPESDSPFPDPFSASPKASLFDTTHAQTSSSELLPPTAVLSFFAPATSAGGDEVLAAMITEDAKNE